MNTLLRWFLCAGLLALAAEASSAADWFVATNGADAASGLDWDHPKATIQAAIDVAASNDVIWVSNGVYDTGVRIIHGTMPNRVALTKPLTVQSVNGPADTTINGLNAVRCAYVGANAVLSGFTLTAGITRFDGDQYLERSGGGAWCEPSALLTNCVLTGNNASVVGGAVYQGTLRNCTLTGNSGYFMGTAYSATLIDCTLAGNSASEGGGAELCTLTGCTISGNMATWGGGVYWGTLSNCTLVGNSALAYPGGAYAATLIDCTIISNSASQGGGTMFGTMTRCTYTANTASNGGGAYLGTQNHCTFRFNTATNGGGAFQSSLNDCDFDHNQALYGGATYSSTLVRCTLDLNFASTNGAGGGMCYGTAQDSTLTRNNCWKGGGAFNATLTNCTISNNLGGDGAGAYLGMLTDCTISGNIGDKGGGAYGVLATRCTFSGNEAWSDGGGTWGGTNEHCTLTGNWSHNNGGGTFSNLNRHCILTGNRSFQNGGGAYFGTLINCLLAGNTADGSYGGGAFAASLTNCTVVGNSAVKEGGGVCDGTLRNCIVYFNTAPFDWNYSYGPTGLSIQYSCSFPYQGTSADHNITNDPQFVNSGTGDYHLKAASPCRDTGNKAFAAGTADLDGQPRIVHGNVDMGAYEFQGYWAWAAAITNGLTNLTQCAAGDGIPNLLKYATGSSPSNSDDLPLLRAYTAGGLRMLEFHRQPDLPDAVIHLETTTDPSLTPDWGLISIYTNGAWDWDPIIHETAGDPVTVTVSDLGPSFSNYFWRLRVTYP
jgi:hypothetical protein